MKIDDLDFAVVELAFRNTQTVRAELARQDAAIRQFLDKIAKDKGLDPKEYYFDMGTGSFELLNKPDTVTT